jgi:hypothetical protein
MLSNFTKASLMGLAFCTLLGAAPFAALAAICVLIARGL